MVNMDEEVVPSSSKRERQREEADSERRQVERAQALFAERLKKVESSLFKENVGRSESVAAKQREDLEAITKEIDAQIKADVEKAKREAEEEREIRRSEAVIARKLYEKERSAKAAVRDLRKQSRVEKRVERSKKEFQEVKEELEEAERKRKKRIEDREAMRATPSEKASSEKAAAASVDKEKKRAEYVRAAALRADALEAANAADRARKAMEYRERQVAMTKSAAIASSKAAQADSVKNASVKVTTLPTSERKLRRWVLESLEATSTSTRSTVEGVRSLVARAVSIGLGEDCPELLEARIKENELSVARAQDVIRRNSGEHAFAKQQYETLVSQGYNRARDRAQRKMDDLWQKKTEAEGSLQYYDAQLAAANKARDDERSRRDLLGLPSTLLLEDDLLLERAAVDEDDQSNTDASASAKNAEINAEAIARKREERAKELVKTRTAKHVAEAEEMKRKVERLRAQKSVQEQANRAEQARQLAAKAFAAQREREEAALLRRRKLEEGRRIAARAEASVAAAAATKAAMQEAAELRKVKAKALCPDATDEDKERARLMLEHEMTKRIAAADAARRCADSLAARRDEFVAERSAARARGDDVHSLSSLVLAAATQAATAVEPSEELRRFLERQKSAETASKVDVSNDKESEDGDEEENVATRDDFATTAMSDKNGSLEYKPTMVDDDALEIAAAKDSSLDSVDQRAYIEADANIEKEDCATSSMTRDDDDLSSFSSFPPSPEAESGDREAEGKWNVEAEEKESCSSLALHFLHPVDETLDISLEMEIPFKWHPKSTSKILDVFEKNFASRKGHRGDAAAATLGSKLSLATIKGETISSESTVNEALELSDGVLRVLCGGY